MGTHQVLKYRQHSAILEKPTPRLHAEGQMMCRVTRLVGRPPKDVGTSVGGCPPLPNRVWENQVFLWAVWPHRLAKPRHEIKRTIQPGLGRKMPKAKVSQWQQMAAGAFCDGLHEPLTNCPE